MENFIFYNLISIIYFFNFSIFYFVDVFFVKGNNVICDGFGCCFVFLIFLFDNLFILEFEFNFDIYMNFIVGVNLI